MVMRVRLSGKGAGAVARPVMHDKRGESMEAVFQHIAFRGEGEAVEGAPYVADRHGRDVPYVPLTRQQSVAAHELAIAYYVFWTSILARVGDDPDRDPPPPYLVRLHDTAHQRLRRLGVDADYMVYGYEGQTVVASVSAYF